MSPIRVDSNEPIIGNSGTGSNVTSTSGLTAAEQEALSSGLGGSNIQVGDAVQTAQQTQATLVKSTKKGNKYYVTDTNGNEYRVNKATYCNVKDGISKNGQYVMKPQNMNKLTPTGNTPHIETVSATPEATPEPVSEANVQGNGERVAPAENVPTEGAPAEPTTNPEIEKAQQKLETTKQNHKNAFDNMRKAKNDVELNRQNLETTRKELEQIQKRKQEAQEAYEKARKALENAKGEKNIKKATKLVKAKHSALENINAKYLETIQTHNTQVKSYNESLQICKEKIKDFSNAKNELNKAKHEVKKAQGEKVDKLKKHNAKKVVKEFKKANPKAEAITTSKMGKVGKFFKGKGGKAAAFIAIGAAVVGAIAYFSSQKTAQKDDGAVALAKIGDPVEETVDDTTTEVETVDETPVDTAPAEAEADTEEAPATTPATASTTTPATAPTTTPAAEKAPTEEETDTEVNEVEKMEEAKEIDEKAVNSEIEAENAEPLYVIKAGDNIWNIVKNQLKDQNNGTEPTNSEIAKGVIKIMDDNDLHFETDGSTVKIYVNQKLKIGSLSVEA
jgi:hypothetical protein